ncbi:subtilisin-like protease SBT1.7 [Panicum miliaceum]|uniref:Subtilisin-like protease SBT1.7 n=1 Tax=Panicum miliaceum TaxID=4540 RepID=A0A3L6TEF9_PANMI|nr:subtilisin-like protease SBT1.7 [Panicum miliaceum]
MVTAHSTRPVNTSRILYTYDTVMHGFAVQLTGDEARHMSDAVGVSGVYEDRLLHHMTTRTPGFLGLDPGFGAWRDTDSGDGVIIGFVDSGIWPESPSFSDRGLGPVRSSWRGKCVGAGDFDASLCNNKLVGAKTFGMGNSSGSPRDMFGHGTHVASTAAGSEVPDTGFLMFARGTARGVTPKARISMYKLSVMATAEVVAGIDAAVKDGVDIISLSLGDDDPHPFYDDALAIAAFGAERKGVIVVLAGGNAGPKASTVTNVAPWMTTVGAATVDRLFPADFILGDGAVLSGQSLYTSKANRTTMMPMLLSSCHGNDLTAENLKGKILVCMDDGDGGPRAHRPNKLRDDAGGFGKGPAGVVLVENSWSQDGIVADLGAVDFSGPILVLSFSAGEKLRDYVATFRNPLASFSFACDTVIGENRAPKVASFSSRGPNPVVPELLKPDVIAPGVNILAAWSGADSPTNSRNNNYLFESGTSMACPHVAGVAALIKKKHPNWTPAMIRLALITTAGALDNTGRSILDDALAMDPGLVYDAGARDYVDFLCALNYTTEQLRRVAPDLGTCTTALPGGPADLNYPSFVVVFDGRTDVRTLTRTVTKVSKEAEKYKVTVVAPEHVKEQYEKRSYTVEFRSEGGGNTEAPGWEFGHIIWENEKRQVRSPVGFQWKN